MNLEVKIESLLPTGVACKTAKTSLKIESKDRLVLHLGECLYRIDNKGNIIERMVPHENSKNERDKEKEKN